MPGLPGRIAGRSRGIAGALSTIAVVALVIGLAVGAGLPGSSQGASPAGKGSGSTTVQQRDLVATDTVSGTLSYAHPHTVFNRQSGTLTSLPAVGQVIKPGQALYQVNGSPVILFDGTTPAYRDLTSGVSNGADVQQLNQNLVKLGFDPSHQITVNNTWQAGTTAAVDSWQASLGETQTGTITLGQVVFLPGAQRITAVDSVLGSTGGAGSGAAASSTSTGASYRSTAPAPEFVSLTTTTATPRTSTSSAASGANVSTSAAARPCPGTAAGTQPPTSSPTSPASGTTTTPAPSTTVCPPTGKGATPAQTLAALVALLKAETAELKSGKSTSSAGASGATGSARTGSAGASTAAASTGAARSAGGGSAATASATGAGASASGAGTGTSSGAATATAILGTTSTQLVVTVALDATKQSEAKVGEPVTVQLPNGNTVDGKITAVSPVAQSTASTSGSSSAAAGGGGASSGTPSATVPITITLNGRHPDVGLDQAAVSVNFQQQVANNVLSVPVTALLATAGGGYAVQEAAAPHQLIPVTTGLFAAGYVQISGAQISSGLQVTDSQG